MLSTQHLPATVGTSLTGYDAVIHMPNFGAFSCAGFADFRAKFMQSSQKMRASQLEIGCGLADFGTVQHQA